MTFTRTTVQPMYNMRIRYCCFYIAFSGIDFLNIILLQYTVIII